MEITLQEKDQKMIWHPYTSLMPTFDPILVTSAEGIYIKTADGKQIIDAISSWWVNLHGHSNPHIAKAIADQALKLEHVIFAGFTHEPAIQLAENLLTILPSNQSKIFFSDNGSTAVEVAIKMAIQFWRNQGNQLRRKIIAFKGAYHGDTFGAMALGDRSIFTKAFEEYLFDVEFIDFPQENQGTSTVDQFNKIIQQGTTAAFIFEPLVQGAAGMRIYSKEVLNQLMSAAHQHNVITIADEVFTGFGRTGKLLACNYLNEKPEIMTLSKGITGGALPLGVTTCSEKIVNAFNTPDHLKTLYHGHSYTANPLVCAAANASFELTISEQCSQAIERISNQENYFAQKLSGHKNVKRVKSLGTILSIELVAEDETGYANKLRNKIYPYFLDRGILLRPLGNIIYVLPPYVITHGELERVHTAIEEFLDSY